MSRLCSALLVFALLAAAPATAAACRWFGTQLECHLAGTQVLIGTQGVEEPTYASPFRPEPFHGRDALLDDRVAPEQPFRLELQNVGTDLRLCRNIGNETYCY